MKITPIYKNRKGLRLRAFDLFAGAGGSSWGAQSAGAQRVGTIDSWELARETYLDNFLDVRFYRRKCECIDPRTVSSEIGALDLMIASPECTSHTCARGNRAPSEDSIETAFQVTRLARVLEPRWIVVENVIQMRRWHRYDEWLRRLDDLGYKIRQQILNAVDFGVPQSRKRLFVMADVERMPPEVTLFETAIRLPGTSIDSTIWQSIAHALGPDAVSEEIETHRKWERGEYRSYIAWMEVSKQLGRTVAPKQPQQNAQQ
jgi:DNA (cytosine-5)-methyltransferase 1